MCRSGNQEFVCSVCPPSFKHLVGTPLRRIGTVWVHLQCATYISEISFTEEEDCALQGIDDIDLTAYTLRCSLCDHRGKAVCVTCGDSKCGATFHVQCALRNNYKTQSSSIFCPQHGDQDKPEPQLPAHKIPSERPQSHFPERRKTMRTVHGRSIIGERSMLPRQVYSLKSFKPSQPSDFSFNKLDDYFAKHLHSTLATTDPLFNKPHCQPRLLNLKFPLVLLTSDVKAALSKWRTTPEGIELLWVKMVSPDNASQIEQDSKCLKVSTKAQDEVTAEILFTIEKLQGAILPITNTTKRILQRHCEQEPPRLNRDEMNTVKAQCSLVTQWGFIYRSLKEGLSEKDPLQYATRLHKYQEGVEVVEGDCSVCFSMQEDEQQLNPMLFCNKCKLWVHKSCYGLWKATDDFVCQVCDEDASHPCWICGEASGIMKRDADTKEWFHLSCAVWDSEQVEFADWHQMNSLRVFGPRNSGVCSVCRKNEGLLVQCYECSEKCHLMCAWFDGMLFRTEDSTRNPHFQNASQPVRRLKISYKCHKHTPDRDKNTQRKLRNFPFKYHTTENKKRRLKRRDVPPTKRMKATIVKS
eukprot:CAMPEP_0204904432 /NCGR_PEP_ID=MMETSP1397-20131031/4862_1 /ASSEMBLY_ACC=CAM_ASM_000891 /TAXON_ID=49980 /ORGANISM="Climacostomum Climacostomum virens, Strain Stock W-24" /LENGTH=581 /DNA_ID=CAMNT_0052073227 /DNA_START=912 /DNA_END=2657 /DNA_ORIENTATION=-